jgi:uncharacterized membrane protein YbhN (UPF0104 family)
MFGLVLIFVSRHGWHLWKEVGRQTIEIHWLLLLPAVVISVVAWFPSMWYWRRLIGRFGTTVPWLTLARAYYCGHLGKYVPGKGAAIVIRSALLRGSGVTATTAALTVTIEALTCMWAGTLLAIVLYPVLAEHVPAEWSARATDPALRWGLFAVVVGGGALTLAALMGSHGRLSRFFHRQAEIPAAAAGPHPLRMTWEAMIPFLGAWWIQGLTLGLTIQAISTAPLTWSDWPFWTGTTALAMVGGFVAVFAPGGLGVREGLLMELLKHDLGPHNAVLAALLLRGVSLAGEILAAGFLYYAVKGGGADAVDRDPGL